MRDGWRQLPLAECYRLVGPKLLPAQLNPLLPYVGLEHLDTDKRHTDRFGVVADVKGTVTPFEPGDVLFGRLRPYLRKVALASTPGVCSPEILVLRAISDRCLPGYLLALARSDPVIDRCVAASAGSRMPRTSAHDLGCCPVVVPPLSEQRRIVDFLGAVGSLIDQVASTDNRLRRLLAAMLRDHLAGGMWEQQTIGDLCLGVIGGIWGLPPGEGDQDVLALGPRVFVKGTPSIVTAGSSVRSVSSRQYASRLIRPGDIILERSGGSPDQPVGRVVIADGTEGPCIPTDFMRLLRPDPQLISPRYLFWRLWLDHADGQTAAYSRRTTGISNLAVPQYLARPISIPPVSIQQMVVSAADALVSVRHCVWDYEAQAEDTYRTLLGDLLLGSHQLPDSYDRFLEPAS